MYSTAVLVLCFFLQWPLDSVALRIPPRIDVSVKKARGFDIPLRRNVVRERKTEKRGAVSGSIGLGDNADLLYSVPIQLGSSVVPVNLDTGSSDLWIVSDACETGTCAGASVTRYPASSLVSAGADVAMFYGDSTTGTYAKGTVGLDTATIAGVAMAKQAFGLINDTTNSIVQYGTAGIFGLGFPSGSKIQESVVEAKNGTIDTTDNFVEASYTSGPLLSRIAMTGALEMPMFSITLQRSTIDISGTGLLTIGKLPDNIDNSSLTWVPVRLYAPSDGGLDPPTFAPDEVYPFRWEIDIDAVYLDGKKLADSTIAAAKGVDGKRVSALIDTGNSILRGPQDVVNNILGTISSSYDPSASDPVATMPCNVPHTIAFQIGGKMFPVDPRDFIGQQQPNDATTCVADNLVSTDPPSLGALYRWSLGAPFFRSNLVAFHYGNITHPSVDPPRIGILSSVPSNADDLLKQAVNDAVSAGGNFEQTLEAAPTASAAAEPQITVSEGFIDIPSTTASPSSAARVTPTTTLRLEATTMAIPSSTSNINANMSGAFSLRLPLRSGWLCLVFALVALLF